MNYNHLNTEQSKGNNCFDYHQFSSPDFAEQQFIQKCSTLDSFYFGDNSIYGLNPMFFIEQIYDLIFYNESSVCNCSDEKIKKNQCCRKINYDEVMKKMPDQTIRKVKRLIKLSILLVFYFFFMLSNLF